MLQFENLSSNIQKESDLAQQAMRNEGQRDEPKVSLIKKLPSEMEEKVNILTSKMEKIKKLDEDVALEDNDEKIEELH